MWPTSPVLAGSTTRLHEGRFRSIREEARNFDLVGREDVDGQNVGKTMVVKTKMVKDGVVSDTEVPSGEVYQVLDSGIVKTLTSANSVLLDSHLYLWQSDLRNRAGTCSRSRRNGGRRSGAQGSGLKQAIYGLKVRGKSAWKWIFACPAGGWGILKVAFLALGLCQI